MSGVSSGAVKYGTGPKCRSGAWLRTFFGCWQGRLLLLLAVLVLSWSLDQRLFALSQDADVHYALTDYRAALRRFGEFPGISLICITVWVLDPCRRRSLTLIVAMVLVASGTAAVSKLVMGRQRPQASAGRTVWTGPQWPGAHKLDPSFPSGHTAAAFALAYGLTRMYPRGRGLFLFFAAACGVSRVWSGKHFLTDVLAGAWLGYELAGMLWCRARLHALLNCLPDVPWYPRGNWSAEPVSPHADRLSTKQGGFDHAGIRSRV